MGWLSSDDHAGGSVGLLMGTLFLVFGITMVMVNDSRTHTVPAWRRAMGLFITSTGAIAVIVGVVFMALPSDGSDTVPEPVDMVAMGRLDGAREVADVDLSRHQPYDTVDAVVFPPHTVAVQGYETMIHVPKEMVVLSAVAVVLQGRCIVFVGVSNHDDDEHRMLKYVFSGGSVLLTGDYELGARCDDIAVSWDGDVLAATTPNGHVFGWSYGSFK